MKIFLVFAAGFCGFAAILFLVDVLRRLLVIRVIRGDLRAYQLQPGFTKKEMMASQKKEKIKCLFAVLFFAAFSVLCFLFAKKLLILMMIHF